VYGAINLGYKDWLYFDVTARNDWNSTLPIDNFSFFYPSVSTSMIFSDALDIPNNVLSFGRIRGSWAKVGNGTSFNQLYNNFRYNGIFNSIPTFELGTRLKSSILKPETTYTTEVGIDLDFFKKRLGINTTYYQMKSVDQIMNPRISPSTGYVEGTFNSGEIRNSGLEFVVDVNPIRTKDFNWDMTFNWSKNNSKVVSIMEGLNEYTIREITSNIRVTVEEGEPYGIFRGSRQMRDAEGNLMVDEANNRALVESNAYLGKISPDFMGSFLSSFRYKNVNLSFLIDYKVGGKMFSRSSLHGIREGNWYQTLENRDDYTFSYSVLNESNEERYGVNKNDPYIAYTDMDRVKGKRFEGMMYKFDEETGTYSKVGPNLAYIQPQQYWQHAASNLMDWFIYDASYAKLREVSVSYSMPSKLLAKTPIRGASIALVGRNLLTLYKNTPKGVDPQATASTGNAQGIEAGFSLPTVYYGFDVKVTF
jgi:outer membrane receptor protein involved in Fe transport